jgi:hypothetical protein
MHEDRDPMRPNSIYGKPIPRVSLNELRNAQLSVVRYAGNTELGRELLQMIGIYPPIEVLVEEVA